jgi:hypothetical protein
MVYARSMLKFLKIQVTRKKRFFEKIGCPQCRFDSQWLIYKVKDLFESFEKVIAVRLLKQVC